jgi:hypothetical protein
MAGCKAYERPRREAYYMRTLTDEGGGKRSRRAFFNSPLEG